jgi:hypothetical protein
MSVVAINRQQRKPVARAVALETWLRRVTSGYGHGIKTPSGNPVHCNTKDKVIRVFNREPGAGWLNKMSNADYAAHFEGRATYYFTGQSDPRKQYSLIMVDIDCHTMGSLDGALEFAAYLKKVEPTLRAMEFEPSTNGGGVHGYILVDRGGADAERTNECLGRLQQEARRLLSQGTFDVEHVEIKGQLAVMNWRDGRLLTCKCGQLAKLPRSWALVERVMAAPAVRLSALMRLPVVERTPKRVTVPVVRGESAKAETRSPLSVGSISGKSLGPEELDRFKNEYLFVAKAVLGQKRLRLSSRAVVEVEDVAITIGITLYCTRDQNRDGTLPMARLQGMWTALYAAGDIARQYHHQRAAACRNLLSDRGLVEWENEWYTPGRMGDQGQVAKGKATEWRASQKLITLVESLKEARRKKESILGINTLKLPPPWPPAPIIRPRRTNQTAAPTLP